MYKGIPKMNFSDTYNFLKNSMKILKYKTFFISGESGIGKSVLIKKLAQEKDALFIDRRLANIMPEDISGIPVKNDLTNSVNFTPVDTMSLLFDKSIKKPIFLFLDEFNLSSREVLRAVFELVYDRTINGKPINPNTYIFAAGNLGEKYDVEELSPALKRRMNYIEMKPDFVDWLNFAEKEIPKFIVKFLKDNRKYFSLVEDGVVYSPAQWFEMGMAVNQSIKMGLDKIFILNLIKSFVGSIGHDVMDYFYKTYTLRDIYNKSIDYKEFEKENLKYIAEDFFKTLRNGNLDFYKENKKFVVDFLFYIQEDSLLNEFVNIIGVENLDGLKEEYQEKLLNYIS